MLPAVLALAGAVIGGAASHKAASDQAKATKAANEENRRLAEETSAANKVILDQMFNENKNMYSPGANAYNGLLEAYANSPEYQAQKYEYTGNINDFYSPAYQERVNQAMNAIQNSRANAGNMFSSNTMNEMNAKAQLMASEEYDKAYDRMMADRQLGLTEFNTNQDQQYKAWQSQIDKNKTLLSMADADRRALSQANNDYYTNLVNSNNALLSTQAAANAANASAYTSPWNSIGAGLGLGTGLYSALSNSPLKNY